jgi:hypothetical protein
MAVSTGTALLFGAGASLLGAKADADSRSDATDAAMQQKRESQAFIQKQIDQARADIFKLYPSAQESRQKGLQAGLDLYSQAYPAMMNLFQQGNVGAQNALIKGLPMANNALLGQMPDYSKLQATQLQQPQGLQMPNPQMTSIGSLGLNQPAQQQQPQLSPEQLAQIQQLVGG